MSVALGNNQLKAMGRRHKMSGLLGLGFFVYLVQDTAD